jgi:hypothetical protein
MTSGDPTAYEPLDYAATLRRPPRAFRLAARGVLVGTPPGQAELTGRRRAGHDLEFSCSTPEVSSPSGEEEFVRGEWHAESDEGQPFAQPLLNIRDAI